MGIIIYIAVAFFTPFVLLLVQLHTGHDLMWIEGMILSVPVFLMFCRIIWRFCLLVFGKKAVGEVIKVHGKGDSIISLRYTDETGVIHEVATRASYGLLKRKRPPERVQLHYLQKYPKRVLIGWRGFIYWLPTDLMLITLMIFFWYANTMY